jgi:hypothetical protein
VIFGDVRLEVGTIVGMSEWRDLTERLVELDLAIEDRDAWATRPEDVEELEHLEHLRDEVRDALARHHVSRDLRHRLEEHAVDGFVPATTDPRD